MEKEFSYEYSLKTDFPQGLMSGQLHQTINSNKNITSQLSRIDTDGDLVQIVFESELDESSRNILAEIITSYVYEPPYSLNREQQYVTIGQTDSNDYQRVAQFIFGGGCYAKLYSISYITDENFSYNVKIYDKTNEKIIIEKNLSNTDKNLQILGVSSYLSSSPAIWEIYMNVTNGKAFIDNIYIKYT